MASQPRSEAVLRQGPPPTWRQRAEYKLRELVGRGMAADLVGAADFTPLGVLFAGNEAWQAIKSGNVRDAIGLGMLAALGAVPGGRFAKTSKGLLRHPDLGVLFKSDPSWYKQNPEKLYKSVARANPDFSLSKAEVVPYLRDARQLALARRQEAIWRDPLLEAKSSRPYNAEILRKEKEALARWAASDDWTVLGRKRVLEASRLGYSQDVVDREAIRATAEAVANRLRKMGARLTHKSTSPNGRVTSRYFMLPDGREVRISDHSLPQTERRIMLQYERGGPRWQADVVVDDPTMTVDDYVKMALGIFDE